MRLTEMLRVLILPDTWAPTGDANFTVRAGLLIVKQTDNGHRELVKLLANLRAAYAIGEKAARPASSR